MLIGIRAADFVLRELWIEVSEKIVWSDSQCVLYWLKSKKPLSVFVENRLKEIKKEYITSFRYIASDQIPSDLATRGLQTEEFTSSLLWWHGPSWLQYEDSTWPQYNFDQITPEVLDQIKSEQKGGQIKMTSVAGISDKSQDKNVSLLGVNEKWCSSLRKLLRVSVYVLRFIKLKVWSQSYFIREAKEPEG